MKNWAPTSNVGTGERAPSPAGRPTTLPFSSTVTSSPARARRRAATRPLKPAPTTIVLIGPPVEADVQRGADWVMTLVEIRSAPAAAKAPTVSRVTPPETSISTRPAAVATHTSICGRRHVVAEHQPGAGGDRLDQLLEAVALDLDRAARPPVLGPVHRLGDAQTGEVVVLHEHEVGERAPVVDAAARPHGRLLEGPKAGRRLAGVPHPGGGIAVRRGRDEAAGERGHAAEVAEEVEGRALPRQHRRQGPAHRADRRRARSDRRLSAPTRSSPQSRSGRTPPWRTPSPPRCRPPALAQSPRSWPSAARGRR